MLTLAGSLLLGDFTVFRDVALVGGAARPLPAKAGAVELWLAGTGSGARRRAFAVGDLAARSWYWGVSCGR